MVQVYFQQYLTMIHSVYGKHEEDITEDAPEPLGKRVVLTHYFDTSLMYDILFGKTVTGVCTFYNKTPTDWYCKQQSTSETTTYGTEFLSGRRKCCENIIDHRAYLRYLGEPVGEMDQQLNLIPLSFVLIQLNRYILMSYTIQNQMLCLMS